ncbi:hypothetical protein [Anaerobacillus sp. CMMVII]|uniref:hypothetical protein n=1 Tax=Anaerobacillus sp. CMMVII TaxID=2755588 RepID=UPI0021B825B2|nr:hypothetical protein [Anaerobacillus sp. CMMVII]
MIKGMSYQNGIFFIGKKHISCAYQHQGQIVDWVKPLNSKSLLLASRQVLQTMPHWFKLVAFIFVSLIVVPRILSVTGIEVGWHGLPVYSIFYFLFGTHFIFLKIYGNITVQSIKFLVFVV